MDAHRFDAFTRRLAAGTRRQAISALLAGAFAHAFPGWHAKDVAAGCKSFKRKCKKKRSCCAADGLRCRRGRCRCRKGWKRCLGTSAGCQHVKSDPDHCGTCGNQCPPEAPCCIDGRCQELCDGSCCADCFIELLSNGIPNPFSEVCCSAGSGTICGPRKKDPSDDVCCYSNQQCVDGECCCDGCEGAVICGGKCCASAACCNGKCCPDGQICATTAQGQTCVPANRPCDNCLPGEVCHAGVCCSGNRICGDGKGGKVCCAAGEYCEFQGDALIAACCPVNSVCGSTYRGRRVRR